MKAAGTLLLLTGIFEGILGIPFVGGSIVLFSGYTALFVMLILHIVTLILCAQNNKPKAGSILGIITSVIAWIPVLGMILHIATAVVLLIAAYKKDVHTGPSTPPAPGSF